MLSLYLSHPVGGSRPAVGTVDGELVLLPSSLALPALFVGVAAASPGLTGGVAGVVGFSAVFSTGFSVGVPDTTLVNASLTLIGPVNCDAVLEASLVLSLVTWEAPALAASICCLLSPNDSITQPNVCLNDPFTKVLSHVITWYATP